MGAFTQLWTDDDFEPIWGVFLSYNRDACDSRDWCSHWYLVPIRQITRRCIEADLVSRGLVFLVFRSWHLAGLVRFGLS